MPRSVEFMDVADSDFLSNKELDDEDSEFESDFEKYFVYSTAKNRFFGRKRPLYVILGSGLTADIILWKKKKISAGFLVGVTSIWLIFKRMDYTLISFICDSLILLLAILFLWSHLASFIKISPPPVSAFILPRGLFVKTAISATHKLNKVLIKFGFLASGQDMKKFILVAVTLGAVSVLDIYFTAATLIYIVTMILLIVPAVYEKHGDIIDILVEKALFELKHLYAELMKKFFGKSHRCHECILD